MYRSALIPCFSDHLFFVSDFRHLLCRYLVKFFPFFIHCNFRIWYFHCMRHGKFVCKIEMTQWIRYISSNMIFMIFMKRSFRTLSRRLVGFDNGSVFLSCTSFQRCRSPCTSRVEFCKALQLASELPTFYACFFMITLNSSPAGSMRLNTRNFPTLSSFRHIFPNLWPQSI